MEGKIKMIRKNEEILKDIEYLVENDLIDIMNESSLFNINDNSLYTLYGELSSIFVISRIYNYILLKFRFNMVNVNTDNYDYVFGIFSRFIFNKEIREGYFKNIINKSIKEIYEEKKDLILFIYNIILDKKFRYIIDDHYNKEYFSINSKIRDLNFLFSKDEFDNTIENDILHYIKTYKYMNDKIKDEKYINLFINLYKLYHRNFPGIPCKENFDIIWEIFQLIKKDIIKLTEKKLYDTLDEVINTEEEFFTFINNSFYNLPVESNGKVDMIKIIKKLLKKKNFSKDLIYNFLENNYNDAHLTKYFIYNSLNEKQEEANDCLNSYIKEKFGINNKSICEVSFWKNKIFSFNLSPKYDKKIASFSDNSLISELFVFNFISNEEKILHMIFDYIINIWNENHKDLNKIKLIFRYFKNIIDNVDSYRNTNSYDVSKIKYNYKNLNHINFLLSLYKDFILKFYHYVIENYQDKIKKSLLKQFFLLT